MANANPDPLQRLAAIGLGALSLWPSRDRFPLLGLTIAVTRDVRQAPPLTAALEARGARVIPCPTIEIGPPADPRAVDSAFERLGTYEWVVFTSANGVTRFLDGLLGTGRDVRAFGSARIAAIGPATAAAVRARGLRVDLVPDAYVAEALYDGLSSAGPLDGARILLARAAIARDVLPEALRGAGAAVDVVEVYRTGLPANAGANIRAMMACGPPDLVAFTSSSTVENFVTAAGGSEGVVGACIGPVTSQTARTLGIPVAVEAPVFTVDGLVDAIVAWRAAAAGGQPGPTA